MLYFKFNSTDETIRQIDAWFDFNFKDEWLYDPMVIEMIKDVDRISEVNGHAIYSEAFGPLSPHRIIRRSQSFDFNVI